MGNETNKLWIFTFHRITGGRLLIFEKFIFTFVIKVESYWLFLLGLWIFEMRWRCVELLKFSSAIILLIYLNISIPLIIRQADICDLSRMTKNLFDYKKNLRSRVLEWRIARNEYLIPSLRWHYCWCNDTARQWLSIAIAQMDWADIP